MQSLLLTPSKCPARPDGRQRAAGICGLERLKNWQDGKGELVRLNFTAESFLALYTGGAVAHKAARMAEGGARKAARAEAVARGATAEELEAI